MKKKVDVHEWDDQPDDIKHHWIDKAHKQLWEKTETLRRIDTEKPVEESIKKY